MKIKTKLFVLCIGIPNINEKIVSYQTDISYIAKCSKHPITQTENTKYYKLHIKYFPSEKEVDIILPHYVKLFSRTAKSYVPVEYIRKSDVLTDYTNNIVQVFENVEVEDFKPTEYYTLKLTSSNETYPITFYVYGIFANILYYDGFDETQGA